MSILISIWLVSCLVHSNGTSKLPPGHILTECAKTSGMPDVVSGSSHYSRSVRSDHLPRAFMGPDDTDEIRRREVRS